jgi:hypothetical protein
MIPEIEAEKRNEALYSKNINLFQSESQRGDSLIPCLRAILKLVLPSSFGDENLLKSSSILWP